MPVKNSLPMTIALCACIAISVSAQTTITGTIKNSGTGEVIAGVNVSLAVLGKTAQTGADGRFTFSIVTSVLSTTREFQSIDATMNGSTLHFHVKNSGEKVRIDIFNLSGTHRDLLFNRNIPAGSYDVGGISANLPAGMYIVRAKIGGLSRSFSLPVVTSNALGCTRLNKAEAATASLAKELLVVDSIIAEKAGFTRSAIPISQYSGDYTIAMDSIGGSSGSDIIGKVVVGYQGWFSCAGDASPLNSWEHMNLEMWPDVREYSNTYSGCPFQQAAVMQPGFTGNLGNGQPAKMFSSYSQQTMNTHFLWMQQNGIDCAALQIFGSYIRNGGSLLSFHTGVAQHMMTAAETYGRKFYIMYDVSSTDAFDANWTNTMINTLHVTSSPAYARQNGKPVVCFWGVGTSGRGAI